MNNNSKRGRTIGRAITGMLVLVAVCVMVSGCAFVRGKYGDRFDPKDIESLKRGVSTRSDVATRLGAPDKILEVNDHEIFQYYNYDLKWGTVLFFSRANVKGQDLYVFFNDTGIVDDVVYGKPKPDLEFQFWPFGD